ncbi:hypothetical protein [Streptomyces atroolivaceus]|nr:hypothetical protein [Streptomyces atroolivaceus]
MAAVGAAVVMTGAGVFSIGFLRGLSGRASSAPSSPDDSRRTASPR